MRRLLHHPNFQALEAAWRSVYFLVRRLETGSALKLCLLDISKQDLAADLLAVDDLTSSGTYRLLVEQTVGTAGGMPWALLLGAYTFDGRTAEPIVQISEGGLAVFEVGLVNYLSNHKPILP